VHNRNYETGHQLAKPSSVFSAEISAIRMALEHIQICPRSRHFILSNSLGSRCYQEGLHVRLILGFMRCKTYVDAIADGMARQAIESCTVHGQMMVANDHSILAGQVPNK
jgi:hypothetical protein